MKKMPAAHTRLAALRHGDEQERADQGEQAEEEVDHLRLPAEIAKTGCDRGDAHDQQKNAEQQAHGDIGADRIQDRQRAKSNQQDAIGKDPAPRAPPHSG